MNIGDRIKIFVGSSGTDCFLYDLNTGEQIDNVISAELSIRVAEPSVLKLEIYVREVEIEGEVSAINGIPSPFYRELEDERDDRIIEDGDN